MRDRLQFVVGKGGVGRTSVAAGLALAAGQRGDLALVVELNGLWDIGRRRGLRRSFEPLEIARNVHWRSLTTKECMADFARKKLRLGVVGAAVMGSRPMQSFVDAIPGLQDLLQLGKIENLLNEPRPDEPHYDLVVIDAPATGHGLTLLSAPESMTDISGAGLFHDLASTIASSLADGRTGVVVTSLPEELPLSETLSLLEDLRAGPVKTSRLVVNKVLPAPLPDRETWPLVRDALRTASDSAVVQLVPLAQSLIAIHEAQQHVLEEFREQAAVQRVPMTEIPMLPSTGTRVDLDELGRALGAP